MYIHSLLWGINPFDQWGVELGKVLAKNVGSVLKQNVGSKGALNFAGFNGNSATRNLLSRYRGFQE